MEITSLQKSVETAENQLGTNDEAIQGLAEEAEKLKEKLRFGQHQFVYDLLFSKKIIGLENKAEFRAERFASTFPSLMFP